jgi:hypothetical protein
LNEKYQNFKLRVLAKTNGANIHKINGLLGHIINGIDLVRLIDETQEKNKWKDFVIENLTKIENATGIQGDFDEFIKE